MLEAALEYSRLGWAVFPLAPGRKDPLAATLPKAVQAEYRLAGGSLAASTDPTVIRPWWTRWPEANVGLPAGVATFVDIDPGAPWPPDDRQRAEIKATGCPLARTPRGGWHLFFATPGGHAWKALVGELAPNVDVRTGNAYVAVAPSTTCHGRYQWVRPLVPPDQLPLPPAWLIEALDRVAARERPSGGRDRRPAEDGLETWSEGCRNSGLFKLACRLRRAGLGDSEIEAALLEANRTRCHPPLAEREVATIARSAGRYPAGPAAVGPDLGAMPYGLRKAWQHAIEHRRKQLREVKR